MLLIADKGPNIGVQTMQHKHTNKLINENSPYLLQHAHNPVNWLPWSNEAFELAVKKNKPVFLSIGYSSCHWCHVMENESFENESIARILNDNFVSIKVDREQRPDIDELYMNAVQLMTGAGGWPLSVFLTPDKKPFYGGTYFPPGDMYGRPGFEQILLSITDAWEQNRSELTDSADKVEQAILKIANIKKDKISESKILFDTYSYYEQSFDSVNGGFGLAPKFPQPTNLSFLLNYWYRTKKQKALEMVELTLEKMAKGGIYDHIGGGFHRYSTDEKWLVPHFEKMLYDQALLVIAYIQAYQATGNMLYAAVAEHTLDYVLRDMTDQNGGFYSAQDADSEGHEGLFYIWTAAEIDKILDKSAVEIFKEYFSFSNIGNFEGGKNILNSTKSAAQLCAKYQITDKEFRHILSDSMNKLYEYRTKRTRPQTDDKIITSWNGLMIQALSIAGSVLDNHKYIQSAEKCAELILKNTNENKTLIHFYRNGKAGGDVFLEDYAFLSLGLIELYQATFKTNWLKEAIRMADQMMDLFYDPNDGGFFMTAKDSEKLLIRSKPYYDSVIPSGNSQAALLLFKLSSITKNKQYASAAEKTLQECSTRIQNSPTSLNAMLAALDFYYSSNQQVIIVPNPNLDNTKEILHLIRNKFLPNSIVISKNNNEIEQLLPLLSDYKSLDGKTTIYVCQNFTCQKPVTDINDFRLLLKNMK